MMAQKLGLHLDVATVSSVFTYTAQKLIKNVTFMNVFRKKIFELVFDRKSGQKLTFWVQ